VKNLGNQPVSWRRIQGLVSRQKRRFPGTHVGTAESAHFLARIGGMVHLVSKLLVRRLAGLFQTISMNVVEPTVIEAAESAVFNPAVTQIGATMRTVQPE
jgi:hypothetical protein